MDEKLETQLNSVVSGYKRTIADKKANGIMDVEESKSKKSVLSL